MGLGKLAFSLLPILTLELLLSGGLQEFTVSGDLFGEMKPAMQICASMMKVAYMIQLDES